MEIVRLCSFEESSTIMSEKSRIESCKDNGCLDLRETPREIYW
jgi:hypothetical protein